MRKLKPSATALAVAALLAACGGAQDEASPVIQARSSSQQLPPAPLEDTARLSAGDNFTVALHANGTVYVWGNNVYGQLGNGGGGSSPYPVLIAGLSGVKAVEAGNSHVTALHQDGTVWAWGNNSYGQMGDGTVSARQRPMQVPGMSNVRTVSAGFGHNLAVTTDGTAWGWGRRGAASQQATPAPVPGLSPVLAASAGNDFSLVVNLDNTVSGWGDNRYGQLGSRTIKSFAPTPVRIEGLANIVAISAGETHALALARDGQVWAWGNNSYDQLGTNAGSSVTPRPVKGLPAPNPSNPIRAIVASAYNSAALYADGSVWMWGSNMAGQLGDGNLRFSSKPVLVASVANVAAVSNGYAFTAVLGKDGSAFGMGANSSGQLGNNTMTSSRVPVQVVGRSGVGVLDLGKSTAQ